MINALKKHIEQAGGYVHPGLVLLVGDEAEHGQVSLAGVPSSEKSLVVPYTLAEDRKREGIWCEFLQELGYVLDATFWLRHGFLHGVMPLLGAANHGHDGRLVAYDDRLELYGTTFPYDSDPQRLKNTYDIDV